MCGQRLKTTLLALLLVSLLSSPIFSDDAPDPEAMTDEEIINELLANLSERERLLDERENSLEMREERLNERWKSLEQREQISNERMRSQIEREKSLNEIENSLKSYAAAETTDDWIIGGASAAAGVLAGLLLSLFI